MVPDHKEDNSGSVLNFQNTRSQQQPIKLRQATCSWVPLMIGSLQTLNCVEVEVEPRQNSLEIFIAGPNTILEPGASKWGTKDVVWLYSVRSREYRALLARPWSLVASHSLSANSVTNDWRKPSSMQNIVLWMLELLLASIIGKLTFRMVQFPTICWFPLLLANSQDHAHKIYQSQVTTANCNSIQDGATSSLAI